MTPEAIAAIERGATKIADAIDRASERNVRAVLQVPVIESLNNSAEHDDTMVSLATSLANEIIDATKRVGS